MKRILRARQVLPVSSPPIEDGVVVVDEGRVEAFGRWADLQGLCGDGEVEDLGDSVLLPGFVNAHCHLDYTCMRGAILPPRDFASWIRRINELKRTLTDADWLASITEGIRVSAEFGTTAIYNISAFPEVVPRVGEGGLRVWWFLELLDIRSRLLTEDLLAGALTFFDGELPGSGGSGLSPHAPYTASAALYQAAAECCHARGMPCTTHLAETVEEMDMFASGKGPLFDFLEAIGRDMSDTGGGQTPVARVLGRGLVPLGTLLAHMNVLTASDWQILEGNPLGISVVHCPGCHRYFGRDQFPLEQFQKLGINVCLGTDSLASNRTLSMTAQMRDLMAANPSVSPELAVRMATLHGALALGGSFGRIEEGADADLISIPLNGEAYESVVQHEGPVMRVGGNFEHGSRMSL
ncbi:MAG: amidohydrolase family protein [Terrimicrobiaceae bacterium]